MQKEIMEINRQLGEIRAALAGREFDSLFFTGCGGGLQYTEPSRYAATAQSKKLRVCGMPAAELMAMDPACLGERSIVIVSSLNGVMPEAVQALRWANEKGAFTIGTTAFPGTPVDRESKVSMIYQEAREAHPYTQMYGITLLITFTILDVLEGNHTIDRLTGQMERLDALCAKAGEVYGGEKLDEFIARFASKNMIYVVGSGPNYANAYYLAICYLLEIQWMDASPINSAEFFHGCLEIADRYSNFVMLVGAGESRKMDERARDFIDRFSDGMFVVDAADYDLSLIDDDLKPYIAQIITHYLIASVFMPRLAEVRHHSLDRRRYYGKMEY